MALKIYLTKRMSASLLFKGKEGYIRCLFEGGVHPHYHGQFATDNPDIQQAIEADESFGDFQTHDVFLDSRFDAEPESGETGNNTSNEGGKVKITFPEAKKMLIEQHGLDPESVKNAPQVKKQLKELGLNYEI